MVNSIDIVRPLVEAMQFGGRDDIQFLGGLGSHALTLDSVELHFDDKLVTTSQQLDIPQYRDDGTLRDLDCLVKNTDEKEVEKVETIARDLIDEDELKLSFFGFKRIEQLERQAANPTLSYRKVHLSDRYVTESEGEITAAKKSLFPFAVDMHSETLENWNLDVDGLMYPISHPGAVILNYATRSVSGVRPKDAEKLDTLTRNITAKYPQMTDWLVDGPGQSQLELARVINSLRGYPYPNKPLKIGDAISLPQYTLEELVNHSSLMFERSENYTRNLIIALFAKSNLVHFGEKHERIVKVWREFVEDRINNTLKNNE